MKVKSMKKVSLRKAIQLLGGENIKLTAGYYYCSGFFDKNGQTYYISTADIRTRPLNHTMSIMYRTAKDRKDFTGGTNQWDFNQRLNEMGYEVSSCPYKG